MSIKKIGVLTYLKEYSNLGTNMQGYCTLKAVQKAYPDCQVELIDYSGWKPSKRPYLSSVSVRSLLNDFTRIKKYDTFFKKDLNFSRERMVSSNVKESIDFIKSQNYHSIYIGSDTLLELKRASDDNLTAYWLDSTVKSKKVLIAASSHNVYYENLSDKQKVKIQDTVDDYTLMGVRDEATFRLMSNFLPQNSNKMQMVPDPTFTYDIEYSYINNYLKRKRLVFGKPVICLHLLRDTKWASQLADKFKKAGYIVASLRPAYYADIVITDLSPFEQVGMYKYFDLVITHRFHDSIFSIKNLTPVIVFPEFVTDVTAYGESKNKTLFKSFEIDRINFLANKEEVSADYIFDIHRSAINEFIDKKDHIRATLDLNKRKYESFVQKSKELCEN